MASYAQVPAAKQLRAAVSILSSAAADRQWGSGDVVRAHTRGLQLGEDTQLVDATTVYMAARGLVGALLDDLVQSTGRDLDEVVGPWLLSLAAREAMVDLPVDDDVA
jgi:hypothetical protein